MKQKLYTLVACVYCLLFSNIINAQHCTGNGSNSGPGVCTPFPVANPGFYPTYNDLPCAIDGVPFDTVISFKAPSTTLYSGLTATVDWIKIVAINNLPCGLCWKTNLPSDSMVGGQTACIRVNGTTFDAPGQYKMQIIVNVKAHVGFISQTLTNQDAEQFGIKYWAKVKVDSTAACITVDTMAAGNTQTASGTAPVASITGNSTVCAGSSITLTAAGGTYYAYRWSNGTFGSSITVNSAGTYRVTAYAACDSSIAEKIVTSPNVSPNLIVTGNTTFCQGGSVGLDAGAGYASYAWSNGASTQNITVSSSGNYRCTVTQSGCTGTSNTVTVTVNNNPTPVITPSGPTTFCQGGSVSLDAGQGYSAYAWSNNTSLQSVTATTGGAYTVTVTQNGCTGTASASVTVNNNPAPTITPSGSTSICLGSSVGLDAGSGYASYAWSNGGSTQTISASQSGSYNVTVTQNGCSGSAAAINITVTDPSVTISPDGPTTFCTGGSVTLDAGTGFSSYAWSNGGNGQSITVTTGGTYDVTVVKNGCTGISSAVTVTVTTNTLSPVITASPSLNICPGGSTTLDVGTGYTSYAWSNSTSLQTTTVNSAATYTVTVAQGACTGTASATVNVGNFPVAVNINPAGPVSACDGDVVTLDAGQGFDDYLWSTGEMTSTIQLTSDGDIICTVTENGCTGSDTVQVIFNANPSPDISATDTINACSGETVNLDAGSGFDAYLWSDATTNSTLQTSFGGVYSVTVTENNCTGTDAVTIIFNALPIPSISPAGPVTACSDDAVTFDAGAGFDSYAWSTGETTQTIQPTTTAQYIVNVTQNGCTAADTVQVDYTTNPHASITPAGPISLCGGETATLDAGSGYASYLWSNNETTQTITVSTGANYDVTVTQNGCSGAATAVVAVSVHTAPVADAVFSPNGGFVGAVLVATPSSGVTYEWQYANMDTTGTLNPVNSNNDTLVVCEVNPGYYRVIVTDANGCSDTSLFVEAPICEGIQELNSLLNFRLMPNPTTDVLNVSYQLTETETINISIIDLHGRNVMNAISGTQSRGNYNWPLNVSQLASGVYAIHFSNGKASKNMKFIKQ